MFRRFLTFGFLLLMAHLLEIGPQRYSGYGLNLNIKDQKIIYGFLGTVVLYEFILSTYYSLISSTLFSFDWLHQLKGKLFEITKKENPEYDEKKIKSEVGWALFFINIIMFPFFTAIFIISTIALIVSAYDVYSLLEYVTYKYTPAVEKLLLLN